MLLAVQFLLCAVHLSGVVGSDLRARAFFDANNVKVGDPLVLTVDFLGTAQFKDLHPPKLSRIVDRRDWKLDDASARTDTYRDARRLTYRVRPMREGVLWFPSIEFEYAGETGEPRRVKSNEIPVHAKRGMKLVVAEMLEESADEDRFELVFDPDKYLSDAAPWFGCCSSDRLDDDTRFAWRKACAKPTADAFAKFDFPAARLNEAACATKEGNWSRALSIYRGLEWRIGQTPEIERGIVAALSMKYDGAIVELPVWRQVLRPLLVHDWRLRAGIVAGAVAALLLFFWLAGRFIKMLACIAVVLMLALSADAQSDPFAMMEQMQQRMRQQMNQMSSGFGFSFGERENVRIVASFATSVAAPQVGEDFEFLLSLEAPKNVSIGQIRITPSENFGLVFTGQAQNLADGASLNPSNVVKRLSIPARYDVPYEGALSFAVEGMVSGRESRRGGFFSMTFSNSFRADTPAVKMKIRPLPSANQPEDFAGVVSEGIRLLELCDILSVETNDVVTITYKMVPKGFVPDGFLPRGAAFEWSRQNDSSGKPVEIEYRRFFVADGSAETPRVSVPYYDPRTKSYKRVETGGTRLMYVPERK